MSRIQSESTASVVFQLENKKYDKNERYLIKSIQKLEIIKQIPEKINNIILSSMINKDINYIRYSINESFEQLCRMYAIKLFIEYDDLKKLPFELFPVIFEIVPNTLLINSLYLDFKRCFGKYIPLSDKLYFSLRDTYLLFKYGIDKDTCNDYFNLIYQFNMSLENVDYQTYSGNSAALLYMYCKLNNPIVTQTKISKIFCITDVTLRRKITIIKKIYFPNFQNFAYLLELNHFNKKIIIPISKNNFNIEN